MCSRTKRGGWRRSWASPGTILRRQRRRTTRATRARRRRTPAALTLITCPTSSLDVARFEEGATGHLQEDERAGAGRGRVSRGRETRAKPTNADKGDRGMSGRGTRSTRTNAKKKTAMDRDEAQRQSQTGTAGERKWGTGGSPHVKLHSSASEAADMF